MTLMSVLECTRLRCERSRTINSRGRVDVHDWLIACIAIDDDPEIVAAEVWIWTRRWGGHGLTTMIRHAANPSVPDRTRDRDRSAFIYYINKPDQRCTRFAATHKSQHTLELSVTQCALQESSPSDLLTESELSPVVTPESSAIGRVGRVALRPGRPVACTSLHG